MHPICQVPDPPSTTVRSMLAESLGNPHLAVALDLTTLSTGRRR
ncbi:MAG: hypothetical protein ACRD0Z_01300 [Acidimicrobiales bacterium]